MALKSPLAQCEARVKVRCFLQAQTPRGRGFPGAAEHPYCLVFLLGDSELLFCSCPRSKAKPEIGPLRACRCLLHDFDDFYNWVHCFQILIQGFHW